MSEFREEVETTRRILNRVTADKLAWRPHPKSMSLGQLAIHIAMLPGRLAKLTQLDGFDVITQGSFIPPSPGSLAEIQATFEESVRDAENCIQGMTNDSARGAWCLRAGDKEIFTKPESVSCGRSC